MRTFTEHAGALVHRCPPGRGPGQAGMPQARHHCQADQAVPAARHRER